jgi:hypothetical protein
MLGVTTALIAALAIAAPAVSQEAAQSAAQAPAAQKAEPRSPAGAPQTSKTLDAVRGTRLELTNYAGEVVVRAWDRNAVRVDARHARLDSVLVEQQGDAIQISRARGSSDAPPYRSRNSFGGSVDYDISVPSWMPLRLSGTFLFVSIEGVQADVRVETVRGDVEVRGGSGSVSLKSIEGNVSLEGATGRINATTAEGDVTIAACGGEITAETLEGVLTLKGLTATVVDASSLDGEIVYDGAIGAQGQYRFTTHDGDVILRIPETTNASVTVRTYEGRFTSSFPVQLSGDFKRGRRVTFALGKGGTEITIEAFDGQIRLLKAGEPLPADKAKGKEPRRLFEASR